MVTDMELPLYDLLVASEYTIEELEKGVVIYEQLCREYKKTCRDDLTAREVISKRVSELRATRRDRCGMVKKPQAIGRTKEKKKTAKGETETIRSNSTSNTQLSLF